MYIYHIRSLLEDAICKSRNYRQIIPCGICGICGIKKDI